MQPIATDAADHGLCVCLCVGHTGELCKTGEPIKMPFGRLTHGSKEPHIIWGHDRTNTFTAMRDDKSAMRPFAKLL